jgi:DNA-binding MarR family transcriptional regulator
MAINSRTEILELVQQLRGLAATGTPENWAGLDLTFTQLRALFIIRRREPLRVSDLGDALSMSLASASALADRLSRLGYVERDRDADDRRTVLLRLSAHGERLVTEQERRSTDRLRRAIEQMTPRERIAVAAALRAFLRVGALGRAQLSASRLQEARA